MKRYTSLAAVLMLAATLAAGCSGKEQKKPENAAKAATAQSQALNVRVATVEAKDVQRSVESVGTLLAWDESIVGSEISGTVEKVLVDLGDRVKAGQTLAILDQREAKLALEQAKAAHETNLKVLEREKARHADAQTTFNRYDTLFKEGMVSASQFDSIRTQLDVAKAQEREAAAKVDESAAKVDVAKKRLADTYIKSPLTGEVYKKLVSVGESVNPQTRFFTVVTSGNLKFRGTISESSAPEVRNGQAIDVYVEAYKDKSFKGKVTRISPSIDPQTRTLEIEAVIPNPKSVLKPGFFARGVIHTKKATNVPFVPDSAVYSFVGVTKLFVIAENTAHERLIKTGQREGGLIEVIDSLKPGETVATSNLSGLYEGAKVNITK